MVQETERLPVRDIRVRRPVPELPDPVLKAARCRCTDVFPREALPTGIQVFENGTTVTVETLLEKGIVRNAKDGVKILGNGELTKKLDVKANAFSASAKEKIEALGGTAEVM